MHGDVFQHVARAAQDAVQRQQRVTWGIAWHKEIGIAGGIGTNNMSIVDRAQMGDQFKPDLIRNLMLATMVGLLLGCLLALGFEYLDDSLKSPNK